MDATLCRQRLKIDADCCEAGPPEGSRWNVRSMPLSARLGPAGARKRYTQTPCSHHRAGPPSGLSGGTSSVSGEEAHAKRLWDIALTAAITAGLTSLVNNAVADTQPPGAAGTGVTSASWPSQTEQRLYWAYAQVRSLSYRSGCGSRYCTGSKTSTCSKSIHGYRTL